MIDGIKCRLSEVNVKRLKAQIDFCTPFNEATGEVMPYSKATWNGLYLTLISGRACVIRGSLHKFAHGGFNHTDFGLSDLTQAVYRLADFFEAEPEHFILQNLETGVNLDYPPGEITDNLILYKTHAFERMGQGRGGRINGSQCILSQYRLKVYGKNSTKLRLELHSSKMQSLYMATGQPGLNMAGLCEKELLGKLGENLMQAWSHVLVREAIDESGLNDRDLRLLEIGAFPEYWTGLQKQNPENFRKKRRRFRHLQDQYGSTDRHGGIARLIRQKWEGLLQT